ncbi:hypothetical protein T484DRAFT_1857487 [Baffinella frigidus]|nr:hypothetical protein T484DRAFT_1857487 [Cryptophyta sp. CCMP2293]
MDGGGGGDKCCGVCKRCASDLLHCAKCKNVWYCGKKCQLVGWTAHKQLCVTPAERVARVVLAINTEIPAAMERWDSATVIKVGLRTVDDFERCVWASQARSDSLIVDLHEQLGRAHSRSGLFAAAAHHFGLASLACVRIERFARQGLLLANKADMHFHGGDFGTARETFAKVENLGEKGGGEPEGNVVPSRQPVRKEPNGGFGKNRMEASALLIICTLSDMNARDFDDKLLNRLLELGAAIEADQREGGTTMHIYALELVARRHLAEGRIGVGVAAYKHVLHLVADPRFTLMEDIRALGQAAKQMLAEVQFFGLV